MRMREVNGRDANGDGNIWQKCGKRKKGIGMAKVGRKYDSDR